MELDQDFNEFVELFIAHDVRFLIIGGYALAAHGFPRYTGDLVAWIWATEENAHRILRALEEFGFGGVGVTIADFTSEDSVVQLGFPPYRIDILTKADGLDFESAWSRRVTISVNGAEVPFISREDFIANKTAVGRPQDLVDVEKLSE